MDQRLIATIVPKFDSTALNEMVDTFKNSFSSAIPTNAGSTQTESQSAIVTALNEASKIFNDISTSTSNIPNAIEINAIKNENAINDLTNNIKDIPNALANVVKDNSDLINKAIEDFKSETTKLNSTNTDLVNKIGQGLFPDNNQKPQDDMNLIQSTVGSIKDFIGNANKSTSSGTDKEDIRRTSKEKMDAYAESEGLSKMWKSLGDVFGNVFGGSMNANKDTSANMSKLLAGAKEVSPYIAVAVSILTAIFKVIDELFERMRQSSKMLDTILGLIESTFGMVFMPLGTIFAERLVPMLLDMYEVIGKWFDRAWDIYDKQGWAGLIAETFYTLIDLLEVLLKDTGSLLWDVVVELVTSVFVNGFNKLMEILGLDIRLDLQDVLDFVKKSTDFVKDVWEWLVGVGFDLFKGILEVARLLLAPLAGQQVLLWSIASAVIEFWEKLEQNGLLDDLVDLAMELFKLTPDFTKIASILAGLDWETIANLFRDLCDHVNNILSFVKSIKEKMGGLIPGFADGGIVTKPTLAMVGEAGPEAIIPLSEINNVSSMSNQSVVNNWYITGISDEQLVSKIKREVSSISSLAKTRVGI